jgi:hypothetical protein
MQPQPAIKSGYEPRCCSHFYSNFHSPDSTSSTAQLNHHKPSITMTTAISFYDISLGSIIHGLKNAHHFISKGAEHAKSNNVDPKDYLNASLHPDMKDFIYQVQRFTDAAKFIPTRINPSNPSITLPDEEKTFPEVLERIKRTTEYLESIDPKTFEGKENDDIVMEIGGGTVKVEFKAFEYVAMFAQANFWFHVTTAYGILRMKGVDVGKMDYLNGVGKFEFKKVEKKE